MDRAGASNWTVALLVVGLIALSAIVAWRSLSTVTVSTIDVSGDAQTELQPDKVDVLVTVETESSSALDSQQQNAELTNRVKGGLVTMGINQSQIETSSYYLQLVRHYDKEGNEMNVTYRTTHVLDVKLTDLSKTGGVIDIAVSMGANRIDGVNFGLSDEKQKEVKSQLLLDAAAAARQKAESIASKSGVKITGVVRINEGSVYVNVPRTYATAGGAEMFKSDTSITPGQITVTASISASYRIE